MKLVDDARDWWKWNSTHVVGVIIAFPYAWEQVPDQFKAMVPEWSLPIIGCVTFLAFLAARVRQQ